MDSLFELHVHTYMNQCRITSLSVSLSMSSEIAPYIQNKTTPSIIYSQFPRLTSMEMAFINYWGTLKKNVKNNNDILFHAPFPQELIEFIVHLPNSFTIESLNNQKLQYSSKPMIPKMALDITHATISLVPDQKVYLLPSTIPYIISNTKIHPLQMIFSPTMIDDLFSFGKIQLSQSDNAFLISEIQNEKSSLKSYISAPKIIYSDHIVPIFEFSYDKTDKKYGLSLFLEATIDNSSQRFPLHLESVREFLKTPEDFAIKGSNNKALMISYQSEIRKTISDIVDKSFQNFYSVMGEIKENHILTNDRINFFEGFLPSIADKGELYHVGKKQKLQFVLSNEPPNVVVAHTNKTPLFGSIDWLSISFEYQHQNIKLTLKDLDQIIQQGFLEVGDTLLTLSDTDTDPIKQLFDIQKQKKEQDVYIQASFLPWLLSLYPNAQIPNEWEDLRLFMQQGQVPEITVAHDQLLRNYQKIGVERLSLLYKFGFGVILADEMGLGKTLQILSFLDLYSHKGKTLIVTPTALLLNWYAEVEKFFPDRFKILIVHGSKQQREDKLKNIDQYDIIITSYHMLVFDLEFYQQQEFHFCIIDEAQHIKNMNSKRAKSVKKIQAHTKIAVSGTPLENNITELWSIFDFIMPDFLGTYKYFQKTFEEPLQSFDLQKRKEVLQKLSQFCSPFIIRRTKDTVYKELPPKIEQTIITELTDKQKSLYLDTLSKVRDQFQNFFTDQRGDYNRIDFLSALTKLRQISLHPGLIYPELSEKDYNLYSSKMVALLELLDEALEANHRVLIFSQFVSMLQIVQKELQQRNIQHLYMDGKTNNRVQLINEFNESEIPVFLISLRAGGIGLNLTGADTVILFDPWWNPAVENQAIDRAHRIGQSRTVNIYRLMTKGTIEEKIYNLQRKKDFLFDSLMQENSNLGTFSSEDLMSLLSFDDESMI